MALTMQTLKVAGTLHPKQFDVVIRQQEKGFNCSIRAEGGNEMLVKTRRGDEKRWKHLPDAIVFVRSYCPDYKKLIVEIEGLVLTSTNKSA